MIQSKTGKAVRFEINETTRPSYHALVGLRAHWRACTPACRAHFFGGPIGVTGVAFPSYRH